MQHSSRVHRSWFDLFNVRQVVNFAFLLVVAPLAWNGVTRWAGFVAILLASQVLRHVLIWWFDGVDSTTESDARALEAGRVARSYGYVATLIPLALYVMFVERLTLTISPLWMISSSLSLGFVVMTVAELMLRYGGSLDERIELDAAQYRRR